MTINRVTWIAATVALGIIAAMFVGLNCDPLAAIVGVPMCTYKAPATEQSWEEDTSWLANAA